MKIISAPTTKDINKHFLNGHLYRHRNLKCLGDTKYIYICSCGSLIDIISGKTQFSIVSAQLDPNNYEDITNQYSLVENSLLENISNET